MPAPSPGTRILRLLVRLEGTHPPVWRRLELAGGIKLPWLHATLGAAMGWLDLHPCRFLVRGRVLEIPYDGGPGAGDGSDRRLDRLDLRPGEVFGYVHDTAREWRHAVAVEAVQAPRPEVAYPRLLGGRGTCPGEDAEGPGDHAALILPGEEVEDPDQDVRWATREDLVHPDGFDLWRANRRFQRVLGARTYA
jgi:hypothetical protein